MWTLLLILGFGGALVLGDTPEECDEYPSKRCPLDISFPESREELREGCPAILTHLECMLSYAENCIREEPDIKFARQTISTAREICREDSPLHAAIGDNLKCIKGILLPKILSNCDAVSYNLSKILNEQRNTISDEEDDEVMHDNWQKDRCLGAYSRMACITRLVSERCGRIAREGVLEVLGRVRVFDIFCLPHYVSDFLAIIPQLNIGEELQSNLLEVFRLKK